MNTISEGHYYDDRVHEQARADAQTYERQRATDSVRGGTTGRKTGPDLPPGALGDLSAQIERVPVIQKQVIELATRLIGPRTELDPGRETLPPPRHGGILGACEMTARELQDRFDDIERCIRAMGAALR